MNEKQKSRDQVYYLENRKEILERRRKLRLDFPEKFKKRDRERRDKNLEECREAGREWRRKNPFYARQKKYGISVEEFKHQFDLQMGKCAICKNSPIQDIDHCHKTSKVRGLLCHNCNVILGFSGDSPEILLAAAAYLKANE